MSILKKFAATAIIFIILFTPYSALSYISGNGGTWGMDTTGNVLGNGGDGGCCGAPIDPDSRKTFDGLHQNDDEELVKMKSDPIICQHIDCFGLNDQQARNLIGNMIDNRRFAQNFAQARENSNYSFWLSVVSLVVAGFSLLVALLAHLHQRGNGNKPT